MRGLIACAFLGVLSAWWAPVKAAEVEVSIGSITSELVGMGTLNSSPFITDYQAVFRGYLIRVDDDVAVVIPTFDRLGGVSLQITAFVGLGVQSDLGRKLRTVTNLTGTGPLVRGLTLAPESSATVIFRREGKLGSPAGTWRGKFVMKLIEPSPSGEGVDNSILPYAKHKSQTLTVKATRSGGLSTTLASAQNLSEAIGAFRQALFAGRFGTNSEVRWGNEAPATE
jgi:hypothetical protein